MFGYLYDHLLNFLYKFVWIAMTRLGSLKGINISSAKWEYCIQENVMPVVHGMAALFHQAFPTTNPEDVQIEPYFWVAKCQFSLGI